MPSSSQSSGKFGDNRFSDIIHPCSDINKNWTIDITKELQKYLQELENISGEVRNGELALNFAEAALVIQGSTSIFGKKVEYLYNLTNQLLVKLHTEGSSNKKDKDDAPGEKPRKAKDSMLISRNHTEFISLDDMACGSNLNMNDDLTTVAKKLLQRQPMMPLSLVPLDTNEKGSIVIYNLKGEELGNKRDFHVNVCTMHSSGCLLLPSTHYDFNSEKHFSEVQCEDYDNEQDAEESDHDGMGLPDMLLENENDVFSNNYDNDQLEIDIPTAPLSPSNFMITPPPSQPTNQQTEMNGPHRRRSTRQIEKAEKELEKKKKEELLNKKAWGVQEGKQPELKKQIQKNPVKKLPKKMLKKRTVNSVSSENEEEVKEDSTLSFCCKNFFGLKADSLARKDIAAIKLGINEALQQLVVDRYSKQQEELRICRKRLKLEDEVKEEPFQGITADDIEIAFGDDDLDVQPLDADGGLMSSEADAIIPNGTSATDPPLSSVTTDDQRISYEDLVRQHVKNYMDDLAKFKKANDLTDRVNKWEERIKPILEEEDKHETFNIYNYGTRLIDLFQNNNRKQTLSFQQVCQNKKKWEVGRYFLASLQLANNSNVELSSSRLQSGLHQMSLTLLSRKRHQEQLDKFGNSCGEH